MIDEAAERLPSLFSDWRSPAFFVQCGSGFEPERLFDSPPQSIELRSMPGMLEHKTPDQEHPQLLFGMVKDDYHKTRALCDDERDVDISHDRQLFMFIYRIQEEVHRFAITRMSQAKRKTLKTSSLEKIPGIGPAKAKLLLSRLGSLRAVKEATLEELTALPGITDGIAKNIIEHFKEGKTE